MVAAGISALPPSVGPGSQLFALQVQTDYDAKLQSLEGTTPASEVRAGEKTAVESAAILLSSENFLPIILLPKNSDSDIIKISGLPVDLVIEKAVQKRANQRLSDLLMKVVELQKLIEVRQSDEASTRVLQLKQEYPGIPLLDFLHASILVLQGRHSEALPFAEKASSQMPEYEEGKIFIEKLKSGGLR